MQGHIGCQNPYLWLLYSPHTGGSYGAEPLLPEWSSGRFSLASVENVKGFGERPLPSSLSSSLSMPRLGKVVKEAGSERAQLCGWRGRSALGGEAAALFGFRAPEILTS